MPDQRPRVIVDPAVHAAEDAFQRMMAMFDAMTPQEWLTWQVEHGVLNPDGSPTLPSGDPCVTPLR